MKQDAWREPWVHCVIRDWNIAETASKGPGEARDARRERDWRREAAAARLSRSEPGLRRGRIVPLAPSRYSLVRFAMHRLTKSYLSSIIESYSSYTDQVF